MAKKSDFITLSKAQKEEYRRLVQFANRRIANAFKAYEKEGKSVVPNEITGGIQVREQWNSDKYAISRSTKFTSTKEFNQQMHWLRQFEHLRPGIKEYSEAQREKTLEAVRTSLGMEVPDELAKLIGKLNAPQLSDFWKKFSDKASKMGAQYSSAAAMSAAVSEYFPEDSKGLATSLVTKQSIKIKLAKSKKPKIKAG